LLLDLDIGIAEFPAGEALERANRVLQVGDLLCLGRLSEISGLGSESNQGRCGSVGNFVGDNIDTAVPRDRNDGVKRSEIDT
jgi:hypothetical protein